MSQDNTTIVCRQCGAEGTHHCSMPGCPLPPLKDTETQSNTTDEAPEEIWTAGPGRWLPDPTNGCHYVRADKLEALRRSRTKPLRDMLDSLYRRRLALVEETDSLEERISHLEGALLKLEGQTDAG